MLASVDDVARALEADEHFAGWSLKDRGDHYLEVGLRPIRHRAREVILVMAWPALWRDPDRCRPHLTRARMGNYGLMLLGTESDFEGDYLDQIEDPPDLLPLTLPCTATMLSLALRSYGNSARVRLEKATIELDLERAHHENELLISIGRALSQQRDIDSLLDLILLRARQVSGADAGSVYIVLGDDADLSERNLRFTVSQNDSMQIESSGFTMPVSSSSIVGTCVLSSEVINIPDLYNLDEPGTGNNPWGFVHDRSFDDKTGYRTHSMLTVPMISARDQVIGVIQLINKHARGFSKFESEDDFEKGVVPFNEISINYATTLASQAGIALENALLYDEVQTLFEGFVKASVTAIESRDPTTSGHSERVADLTVGLAKAVDRSDSGSYAGVLFNPDEIKQIHYAGLLHDFGKVGVREPVLVKAMKLYPHQRQLIEQRFQFIRRTFEVEKLNARVGYLLEASRDQMAEAMAEIDKNFGEKMTELDSFLEFVLQANKPSLLAEGGFERVSDIAARTYLDTLGQEHPYLEQDEVVCLQVLKGTLTAEERSEIESHVVHTFNFLSQIPWGRAYREVPNIAGAHHEKLNGKGYPHGLSAEQIPLPAKMMTISDIFDALTASDRPYKRAVPTKRALDILGYEVKDGHLDPELYQLFLDAKVFSITVDDD